MAPTTIKEIRKMTIWKRNHYTSPDYQNNFSGVWRSQEQNTRNECREYMNMIYASIPIYNTRVMYEIIESDVPPTPNEYQ